MAEGTTIVLELTPREAAAVQEMALMYNWHRGDYSKETRAVYDALESVRAGSFDQHRAVTKTEFGSVDLGLLWIEENEDWTIGF